MDTFSLLTGIASGAAATLIGQRVVIELRERRAEQRRRLTERIKTLEHILSRRRSENAETLSRFSNRLAAIERRLSEVANLREADDRRLDNAFGRLNAVEQRLKARAGQNAGTLREFSSKLDNAFERINRIERTAGEHKTALDELSLGIGAAWFDLARSKADLKADKQPQTAVQAGGVMGIPPNPPGHGEAPNTLPQAPTEWFAANRQRPSHPHEWPEHSQD